MSYPFRNVAAAALLGGLAAGAAAQSGGDQFSGIKQQLAAEKQAIASEELKKLIEIERAKLTESLKRLETLEARVKQLEAADAQAAKPAAAPAAAAAAAPQPQPRPAAQPAQTAQQAPSQVGQQQQAQAQRERARDASKVAAVSDDVRGILTPRGTFTFEPSIKYAQSSSDRVFLEGFGPLVLPSFFLGIIDIREVDRKSVIGAFTGRYGITNRLQVEAKVPYVWRDDSTRSRPITETLFGDDVFEASGDGIGDVEFAVDYQFNDGTGGWPFFTGSLRVKTPTGTDPYSVETFDVVITDPDDPEGDCVRGDDGACLVQRFPKELATGTGTWSIQPSLTFLYPTDPAVFFGTVDYSFNLEEDFGGDVGEVDPGDAIGISGGMGFGINDRSSFSLGFSYKHGFKTRNRGITLNGSDYDIGTVNFGYSFRWSQRTNINLSVAVGATDDAQDFELNLRVPINYNL